VAATPHPIDTVWFFDLALFCQIRRERAAGSPELAAARRWVQSKNFSGKIQSIYNGKRAPITMQGFAQASENPPAQEQRRTMEKQWAEQSEQSEQPTCTTDGRGLRTTARARSWP
jgi:hypothetical protein